MGNDDDLGGSYRPFSEEVTKFQTHGFVYNKVYWPEAATLSRGGSRAKRGKATERSEGEGSWGLLGVPVSPPTGSGRCPEFFCIFMLPHCQILYFQCRKNKETRINRVSNSNHNHPKILHKFYFSQFFLLDQYNARFILRKVIIFAKYIDECCKCGSQMDR